MNSGDNRSFSQAIFCATIDFFMVLCGFGVSFLLEKEIAIHDSIRFDMAGKFVTIFFIFLLVFFLGFDMYSMVLFPLRENVITIILSCFYTAICTFFVHLFFYDSQYIGYLLLGTLCSGILLLLWRNGRYRYYKKVAKRIHLVILERKKENNSRVRRLKYSCLNQYESWYEQIDVDNPDEVEQFIEKELPKYGGICLMESIPSAVKDRVMEEIIRTGKELFIVPGSYDINLVKIGLVRFDDVLAFQIRPTGLNRKQRFLKRTFDIVAGCAALAITMIPMGIIAILIKFTSPGSVIYQQERLTRGQKKFNIYKFRTMRSDAEAVSGPMFSTKDDPRVTKVGKILRKTRVDELPQLFNILKGEMSFVGPRPERPFFVNQYLQTIDNYSLRFDMKAGLTSLSHVYGRYNTEISDRTLYDLLYIRNYSFFLDLQILLLTSKIIFMKDAAEGLDTVEHYQRKSGEKS